jgi:hypothetical protein
MTCSRDSRYDPFPYPELQWIPVALIHSFGFFCPKSTSFRYCVAFTPGKPEVADSVIGESSRAFSPEDARAWKYC